MTILTAKIIKQAAKRKRFDLRNKAFAPKDIGLTANQYGSFSDYCDNTKSSIYNKRVILTAVEFGKGKRPKKYKLTNFNFKA